MKVGFIGAGCMATTMGRHLINAGHEVVLSSSRGPEALAVLVAELGPAASAGSKQEAAECDVVILATNWADAPVALKRIEWSGRILVDGTNAHLGSEPDISADGVARSVAALEGRTSSETIAAMAPGARLVKSISNMPMAWIQDFSPQKPKTVLFVSGDDRDAKALVVELIDSTGLVALDLGSLSEGGRMQQLGGPLSAIELHFVRRIVR
ncbi:NADPH-dependent F420 reductase [Puniceibacterium sp. IMCC21224]|uniref:NADPH-dependent F420 reductase n=1 Tax=Puniceibacterium sp. IMCC21224 TaxID=1618204 RepID=UPI00064DF9C7|nr:NAD(P)-binding domain-containing protein [Puniceibacterium sp. IMCC21224]KMK69056.1 putative dinucleotide-binding enzyme [Puniceibacterium sp. IMCC21224]